MSAKVFENGVETSSSAGDLIVRRGESPIERERKRGPNDKLDKWAGRFFVGRLVPKPALTCHLFPFRIYFFLPASRRSRTVICFRVVFLLTGRYFYISFFEFRRDIRRGDCRICLRKQLTLWNVLFTELELDVKIVSACLAGVTILYVHYWYSLW